LRDAGHSPGRVADDGERGLRIGERAPASVPRPHGARDGVVRGRTAPGARARRRARRSGAFDTWSTWSRKPATSTISNPEARAFRGEIVERALPVVDGTIAVAGNHRHARTSIVPGC
jgi:hypothetical protein